MTVPLGQAMDLAKENEALRRENERLLSDVCVLEELLVEAEEEISALIGRERR